MGEVEYQVGSHIVDLFGLHRGEGWKDLILHVRDDEVNPQRVDVVVVEFVPVIKKERHFIVYFTFLILIFWTFLHRKVRLEKL